MNISNTIKFFVFGTTLFLSFAYALGQRIVAPSSFMFSNSFDAMKNYFTFYSYYLQNSGGSIFAYQGMNYPFGDSIFFTDQTPLVSLFSKYVVPWIDPIGFYNSFFLCNIFVAGIATFAIGNLFKFHLAVNVVFGLFLAWMNPQVLQLGGAVNLSLSAVYIGSIYLFIRDWRNVNSERNDIPLQILNLPILITILVSALIHLYYPVILLVFLGTGYLYGGIFQRRKEFFFSGFLTCSAAIVLVFALLYFADGYLPIRPSSSQGYDLEAWSGNTRDWFSSYLFLDLPSFYKQTDWSRDTIIFLGSGFVPAILLTGIVFLLKRSRKTKAAVAGELAPLLFGAIICYFVSLGPTVDIFNGSVRLPNLFNPFYYLSFITDYVTHFRFTVRFGLPVFYTFTLTLFYFMNQMLKSGKFSGVLHYLVFLILGIYLFDALQAMHFAKNDFTSENVLAEEELERIPEFDTNRFDAILPLPYYHVGSETKGFIIDDKDEWSRKTYQLSIKNRLPLMSSKMSRTPLIFTKEQFDLLRDSPSKEMMTLLKGKHILVAHNHSLSPKLMYGYPADDVLRGQSSFINKLADHFLFEQDEICYFNWEIK